MVPSPMMATLHLYCTAFTGIEGCTSDFREINKSIVIARILPSSTPTKATSREVASEDKHLNWAVIIHTELLSSSASEDEEDANVTILFRSMIDFMGTDGGALSTGWLLKSAN